MNPEPGVRKRRRAKPRRYLTVAALRVRLAEARPKQWWRKRGYGFDGKRFHCPCCGGRLEMTPLSADISRVPRHPLRYGGRCIFSGHCEMVTPGSETSEPDNEVSMAGCETS